jgi:hypothetical protein
MSTNNARITCFDVLPIALIAIIGFFVTLAYTYSLGQTLSLLASLTGFLIAGAAAVGLRLVISHFGSSP